MNATDRVRRGVLQLDDYRPNWREVLSVDELDVANMRRCPVGQTFELNRLSVMKHVATEWRAALVTLGSPARGRGDWKNSPMHHWAVDHGFDATYNEFTLGYDFASLNRAWRACLTS